MDEVMVTRREERMWLIGVIVASTYLMMFLVGK